MPAIRQTTQESAIEMCVRETLHSDTRDELQTWGFNARHNSIRNFEAGLLREICYDVQPEPPLQPVGARKFLPSVNVKDDARSDVRARGFWREGQHAFFDICVTNADCASQEDTSIKSVLRSHELKKKRKYNTRIMDPWRLNRARLHQLC